MKYALISYTLLGVLLSSVTCADDKKAIVALKANSIEGNVTFTQAKSGAPVQIQGIIIGLTAGKHGFHIHEKGDLTKGCVSTGSHFNPEGRSHGSPDDSIRHVGDLGNIEADENGVARINLTDRSISLSGRRNILGRALVVHSDEDDLGRGGASDSLSTGHAGSRLVCGIVGLL